MAKFILNRNLDKELRRTKAYQLAISEEVQEAARIARSLAPVGTKTHTLKGGWVDRPGDYRDSIGIEITGRGGVVLRATDYKAHWIEWGSAHNPPHGVLRRAVHAAGLEFKEAPKGTTPRITL